MGLMVAVSCRGQTATVALISVLPSSHSDESAPHPSVLFTKSSWFVSKSLTTSVTLEYVVVIKVLPELPVSRYQASLL